MDQLLADFSILAQPPRELPPPIAWMSLAFAFVVASMWGSFLNVVIARAPHGESVVHPRSRCPSCKTQIAAWDNVPIVSWLLLRAKCRHCGLSISARYPFVELLMGLLGVALVARSGYSLAALESFIFCALLVAIAFIDIDTFTVPDSLVGLLAVNGLLFGGLRLAVGDLDRDAFYGRLIGAVAAFVVLGAIIVVATGLLRRTRRAAPYFQRFPRIQAYLQARELPQDEWAMGWGDPLIMIGIGAHLGWQLLPITLFLASVQGSIVGMVLLPLGKLKHAAPVAPDDDWIPPAGAVPFGPFLALAALEAAFFSSQLNGWLVQILGLDQF